MQVRKHYTQFNQEEKNTLKNVINNIDIASVKLTLYTMNRLEKRNIKLKDIVQVFKKNNIIEYNIKNNNCKRILIRGKESVNNNNICLVYSVTKNTIITAYTNRTNDEHFTIDLEKYDKNLTINFINR